MRLIGFLSNEQEAGHFSQLLQKNGIEHQIESSRNSDWGSSDYGNPSYKIWVVDEDQLDRAVRLFEAFQQNPDDQQFTTDAPVTTTPQQQMIYDTDKSSIPVNTLTILLCCFLYILSGLTQPTEYVISKDAMWGPLFSSPVRQVLMYDYPLKYELLNELVDQYGVQGLTSPDNLPSEGRQIMKKFTQTNYWQGVYGNIIQQFKNPDAPLFPSTRLFEKISQGEVWRTVTPILLHGDLLHLFFNMIWLYALGRQVAFNLKPWRYLVLVIVAAIFSNTAQYLMTGANFLGFSGVLCAMLSFIWTRQNIAPWEKYILQRSTFMFMTIFVFCMAGFQLLSFLSEMTFKLSFAPGIANTAHISGLLFGFLLGKLNYFAAKS